MADDRTLVMPKLGLTMTEGMVASWEVAPGQAFETGTVLVVVESEKASYEVEAPAAGTLEEIVVQESETVAVGAPIARWRAVEAGGATAASDGKPAADGSAAPAAAKSRPAAPDPAPVPASDPPAGVPPQPTVGRTLATPLARRLAREAGIEVSSVPGSGPKNRVQARDIEAMVAAAAATPAAKPLTAPSGMQRTMASRMLQAKREIPHFYLSTDMEVSALLALRVQLNALPDRPRISISHLLVAAIVDGLRRCPDLNRTWTDDGILTHEAIDIGIAVDTDRGLVNPVLRDLAGDSLYGIARKFDALVGRARNAKLRQEDFGGGAITLSNAGMHRLHYMTSIVVPGQSAILGVGSLQELFRPGANGEPVAKRELGVTLSADHRIHTGVSALAFLGALEDVLTEPLLLLAGK